MSSKTKIGDDCKIMNESSENLCVVCFKNVEIYSIGECDHPVCYECSTRMRVLCEQNECPICRQSLSKVIFTNDIRPYRELEATNRSEYYNKKYKICFANLQIQKAFYDLLDHPCPRCDSKSFYSFDALKEHVRKEHELFYCDICVAHLRIFSFERKCYNRHELALHRRKGDPDNTSHRGHPLCQYCDLRYLDRDELFRHLRREHFFCHFCDADGSNQFYADYNSLCDHFRSEHYLCEEGDCASEQFTATFRTEIDLKAHIANVHCKSLGKQQAKQARTLQLEITLGPRGGRSGNGNNQPEFPSIANIRSHRNDENYSNSGRADVSRSSIVYANQNPPKVIDANNDQEFPSLRPSSSGTSATAGVTLIHPNMSIRAKAFGPANIIRSRDEFPALGSTGGGGGVGGGGGSGNNYDTGPNIIQNKKYNNLPVSAILKSKNAQQQTRPNSGGSSMVIHVSNRPNINISNTSVNANSNHNHMTTRKFPSQRDFPALPGSSTTSNSIPTVSNSVISAKHRSLINDYVSAANPTSSSKITVVQKETTSLLPTSTSASSSSSKKIESNNANFVPSLTNNDFPALTSYNSAHYLPNVLSSWTKSQKMQDYENRKTKIAPAPILNNVSTSSKNSDSKKEQKQLQSSNNNLNEKKDKKLINNKTNDKKTHENHKKSDNVYKSSSSSNKENKKVENNNENKVKNSNKKEKSSSSNVEVKQAMTTTENQNSINPSDNQQINFVATSPADLSATTNFRSTPPPGFDKLTASSSSCADGNNSSIKSPPPGFKSVTLNSVAKSPNNLTFTTSLGEIFSIVPNHQYIPPPNSMKRNQELVTQFQNTLSYPEAFEEFKLISQKFREGHYKALPYYEHCQVALKDKFDELFPELLILLPDINKQQELYLVHCQYMKEAAEANNKKNQKKLQHKLEVCPTCKQVLKLSDKQSHTKAHSLENNFPALNGNLGTLSSHSYKNKKQQK